MSGANKDKQKDLDVLVVGSIIMDLISYGPSIPRLGETVEGSSFATGFGGKGANQAVAAARLGASVAFIGKVGEDANGSSYLQNLKAEGISTFGVSIVEDEESGLPTGVAVIMVSTTDGENVIMMVPGANKAVSPAFVTSHEDLISRAKVVLVQLEIPLESTLTALRLAKKHSCLTIFNSAPALANIPEEILSLTDILCLNETEAQVLSGSSSSSDPQEAIKVLLQKHPSVLNIIIVTLGAEGALVWEKDKTLTPIQAPKVAQAVDTTGAGDAFLGTLAVCLQKKMALIDAVTQACRNATDSILRRGTQSSFPNHLI